MSARKPPPPPPPAPEPTATEKLAILDDQVRDLAANFAHVRCRTADTVWHVGREALRTIEDDLLEASNRLRAARATIFTKGIDL